MARLIFIFLLLAIIFSARGTLDSAVVSAQSTVRWSVARQIPRLTTEADPPFLVVDQNRTVHAFYSQWIAGELAVYYNQWTVARIWTAPNDILLSPISRQASVQGAYLDPSGMMHAIFFGGIESGAEIFYARAPVASAAQASAWSSPKSVGVNAGKLAAATLSGDAKGNLYILYSGNGQGNGVYAVHSNDAGETWSETKPVFLSNSEVLWSFAIRSALDATGKLHGVWTVVNKQGNGEAVYYARYDPERKQWSIPRVLQSIKECSYEADWASITAYKDEVWAVYSCGAPATRWLRRSRDNGVTWSEPTIPFPFLIGETGPAALMVDSRNALHLVFASRINGTTTHGLWHSVWSGERWSEPDAIISGRQSIDFDPSRPNAIISQGNVLLVTWRQDYGLTPNGVWYSFATLDAPELPVLVLPTPLPTPTPIPTSITPSRLAL
ncbi:MAG: exo-alpha-sialidase, partial [Chloroflexi bacterium]|nr:exo-alpha-sialidase [Chloroflexota bacterium]